MNPVQGVGNQSPVQKIISNPIQKEIPAQQISPAPRGPDKLELSGVSHLLKTLKTNDVRTEKVQQIRAQIANGTYETDEKLDAAADKLLDDLIR
jgi:negative regulator of flagellin synthesis FlgM